MAADITLTPAPGQTIETTIDVRLSGTGYDVILASSTSQPTFAKNIAYDEFGNPFISVVQDGRGNVFFDGGFPKYYNTFWTNQPTFDSLSNQLKLLFNAFRWCSEGRAAPTKRALLFGDMFNDGSNYAVKGTDPYGFYNCIRGVGALAGYTVDVKDFVDYPAPANIPYSDLTQYDVVIFMSSLTVAGTRLTETTRTNVATYRQQGGGVMIITDHNVFQTLANEVASLFNCSFSGNVDRHPVSVDDLIANYGMHPLWANMTGDVFAGGSEGIVTIPPMTPFNPATDKITLVGPGYRTVYLTISDTSGVVTTYAYSYAMNVPEPVSGTMPSQTSFKFLDLPFEIIRLNNTDTSGTISVDGLLIGTFTKGLDVPVVKHYTYNYPEPVVTTNGKTVQVSVLINNPVIYNKTYQIALSPKVNTTSLSAARRWSSMRNNEMQAIGPKGRMLRKLKDEQGIQLVPGSNADALRAINSYYATTYNPVVVRTSNAIGGVADSETLYDMWGYEGRLPVGSNFGTIDSTAPMFGIQIMCAFFNYTLKSRGTPRFAVSFRRTDNANQVVSNFAGRRIQLIDASGSVVFDEDVSTATVANASLVNGFNTFGFEWDIPASLMKTPGSTWKLGVV